MDELTVQIEDLMAQGYNCSQIMLLLSLEMRDLDNPELINAMAGLGKGMWAQKACGTLTGAACMIASYGAAGPFDNPGFPYKEVVKNFVLWFEKEYGAIDCKALIGDDKSKMFEFCPGLIERCFTKCGELLTMMDVDLYE